MTMAQSLRKFVSGIIDLKILCLLRMFSLDLGCIRQLANKARHGDTLFIAASPPLQSRA